MKYVELGNLNIPIVQPKKGVDYYTDIEKEEIIEEVSKRVNSTIEPMENERQTSETQRESNEEVRNSQENTRQVNESERISNETIRQNNEDIRLNNENLRLSNEQNRVEAEELRNANFVNQMSKNEEALQNIKDMTVEYNENAVSKVLEFNNNCQVRTEDFNNNAEIQKGNFDANANEKIAQYNAHVSELTEDISNIKYEQNLQNTKLTELENKNIEQDTEISNLKQEDITQNTNIQNNAKGLEELQQENIKLKEKLEKQNSQIPTGQASGENITINDSSNLPFEEFKITGNSKQDNTPTPETPVDIKNVTSVNVKVCNENILYDGFAEDFLERVNNSSLASIEEINGKKYLKFAAAVGIDKYFLKGLFKENTQYTFNSKLIVSKAMVTVNLRFKYMDGTSTYKNLTSQAVANEEFDYSFTSEAGKTVESLAVLFADGITYMDLSTATIVEGTSTDYIERQTQSFNFPLSEGQKLCRKSESEYDYLSDEGIVNILEQIDETGTKTIEESFAVRETSLITPYTEEQQLVYDQIREACSYKNVTNIFSLDEVSPIIEVTYKKDLETMFNNINNAILGGN